MTESQEEWTMIISFIVVAILIYLIEKKRKPHAKFDEIGTKAGLLAIIPSAIITVIIYNYL